MQILGKKIHKPSHILQQLYNRIQESNTNESKTNSTNSSSRLFGEFVLDYEKEADSYCLISPNIPIQISGFGKNGSIEFVLGYRCLNVLSFYKTPIDSSILGIFCYENISELPELFDVSKVEKKFFRIRYKNQYILIPLLHSVFHSFSPN